MGFRNLNIPHFLKLGQLFYFHFTVSPIISSQTVNSAALGSVDKAIEDVSVMRSKYGATFNQVFAAINNLKTVSANLCSSISVV